jgi:DNA-binding response OmpR family regulator
MRDTEEEVEDEITPPGPGKAPLVAVVDDDPDIIELVSVHLKKTGMKVREFLDAESFYRFLRQDVPDLVLLDLMLPDADGVEVCKFLRRSERLSAVPVIMLTAKADEVDRVLGLEIGADDYVTKPFSPKELVARVKAVLRRTGPKTPHTQKVEIGGLLTIDLHTHQVAVEGRAVEVTSVEFRILEFLASKTGWVFSREKILDFLWGHDKIVSDRTVDVHIRHLREKLGRASGLLKNVRGAGYKLEA